MEERRKHRRVWERIQATIKLRGTAAMLQNRDVPAIALNLSEGGAYVEIEEGAVGGANSTYDNLLLFRAKMEILFVLPPRNTEVRAECKTVWISQEPDSSTGMRGIALQFVSLDEEARKQIAGFAAQRQRSETRD